MGLDGVELVIAFEEEFALTISDADAEKMITPGDVVDYVFAKLGTGAKHPCLTQRAFFTIRKRLIQLGRQRAAITPATLLEEVLPKSTRRSDWAAISAGFTCRQIPELVLPAWLDWPEKLAAFGIGAWVAWTQWHIDGAILLGIGAWIFTLGLLLRCDRRFRVEFPGMNSVADLVESIASGPCGLLREGECFERAEIAETVKRLVLDHLGIAPKDYAENRQFVRDFGMD